MEIVGLVDIPVWVMLTLCLLLLLYIYGTWHHSVWTSQSVPGPKPWPLLGNSSEIRNKSTYHVYREWKDKYGPVVGHFVGRAPCLSITDLDMVQEVMVKQFNNFTERNIIRGMRTELMEKSVFFVRGSTWKRIRSLMTPAFTVKKLKLMSRYVTRCSGLLVKSIEQKANTGELIDIKNVFQAFTLDVIAGTGFGLDTNSQTQDDEPFIRHCREIFSNIGASGITKIVLFLVGSFPFLAPVARYFMFATRAQFFVDALEKMVDERLEQKNQPGQKSEVSDILQMLVNTEADAEDIDDSADSTDDTKSHRSMTKEEIMAQGFILLIAAFETTATTLQYLTYQMALHPDVQEKIVQEIREELGDDDPTYQNVPQLKYLDAAIRETLRMFSPLGMVDRKAEKAVTIKGVHIPADCGVTIPIHAILNDPEHFPEPEVFNPDRFLEGNSAKITPILTELFFGYGPRKCIGMRLGLLEIKTAVVSMLRKVRFQKCAETPEKVYLGKGINLAMADKVIKVKAELRSA